MVKECRKLKYIDRLKFLQLPCLRYRRIRGDMITVYSMLRNRYEGNPTLNTHEDERTRGHNLKLNTNLCRKKSQETLFYEPRGEIME